MPAPVDPRIRQLKIKTGVCKRSGKEKLSYLKEAQQQKDKIEKMKTEGEDEYKVKKMQEVLSETQQMVPDCHRRLVAARADLEKSIAELEPDFGGDPQKEEEPDENLVAAKQVLKESEAFLPDELPPPPPTSAAKTDETAKEPATAEAK